MRFTTFVFPLLILGSGGLAYRWHTSSSSPSRPKEASSSSLSAVAASSSADMNWVPAGRFRMGCRVCGMDDTQPVHTVALDGFWLDRTPVTNADFAAFVQATSYVTLAERPLDAEDYPGVPADKLVPGSAVFSPPSQAVSLNNAYAWWSYVPGANWRHPHGPSSEITKIMDHPVVQVAYEDAVAYCQWRGQRLPTEAEYEYAARGGMEEKKYAWGDDLKPGGKWMANIWQGHFPDTNSAEDGYRDTSPVRAFPANAYGLFDMAGNVWQWTSDWYRPDTYRQRAEAKAVTANPRGPLDSHDPQEPHVPKRVQRGGSFLCSDHYCTRYLVGSRGKGAVDSASSNVGFRCAVDGPKNDAQ